MEIEELISKVGNGNKINFSEYLCMMVDLKEFISFRDDLITALFKYFDVDGNGLITQEDISHAFNKCGRYIDVKDAKTFIKSVTANGLNGFNQPYL